MPLKGEGGRKEKIKDKMPLIIPANAFQKSVISQSPFLPEKEETFLQKQEKIKMIKRIKYN